MAAVPLELSQVVDQEINADDAPQRHLDREERLPCRVPLNDRFVLSFSVAPLLYGHGVQQRRLDVLGENEEDLIFQAAPMFLKALLLAAFDRLILLAIVLGCLRNIEMKD